jgi:hypothetical protein
VPIITLSLIEEIRRVVMPVMGSGWSLDMGGESLRYLRKTITLVLGSG